jgi:hypothetical protein
MREFVYKIAEGSIYELQIIETASGAIAIQNKNACVLTYIDDLPKIIKILTAISKGDFNEIPNFKN